METDNVNYHEWKKYHDYLGEIVDSIAKEKLTDEVREIIDVKRWKERLKWMLIRELSIHG
jgi:hypothetical protein